MIEPYFVSADGRVALYHGDCIEIMPQLNANCIDAVVADPPYGIADVWKGGSGHGWGNAQSVTAERNQWDACPPSSEAIDLILSIGKTHVLWGGNYFGLPVSRGWLVWVKPERNFTLSEAELAWTDVDMPMRVLDWHRSDVGREHPTQKPLGVMVWCMEAAKIPTAAIVADPYMGSGTTGVACIKTGRGFIGIEAHEPYCEIAKRRIESALAQPAFDMAV